MSVPSVLFQKKDVDLLMELKKNINAYFKSADISMYAGRSMWIKISFWLLSWLGTYLLIIFGNLTGPILFVLAILHLLVHLFIAFNIAHDANHGAISSNNRVNIILSYSLDLIGVSSFLWRISHNQEHHGFINVHGIDPSIEGYGILRFSPEEENKKAFRLQHLYALFLYGISTLNYVLIKDFKIMGRAFKKGVRIKWSDFLTIVLFKAFYWTYMFVIPLLVLDITFGQIILAFICGHFMVGMILSLVFQCGHLTEEAHYPQIENGRVSSSWVIHIIQTTGDFAVQNRALTWLVGGINIHVIHHLFPTICHTHYEPLSRILRDTVEKYGVHYREIPTFRAAIISHVKLLKGLGSDYVRH